jgi:hypothetical protein
MAAFSRFKNVYAGWKLAAFTCLRQSLEWARFIEPIHVSAVLSPSYPDLESLPERALYVVGGADYQKWAFLICPCGCGDRIMLSLSQKQRPRWQVEVDWLGRPTVKPSIWQTEGCFSHFWLKKGRVHWTADTGQAHHSRVGSEG